MYGTIQKRILKLVPYREALKKIQALPVNLSYETVSLERAVGRVLAEDVTSKLDIPQTDRSLVDGYALKSVDTLNASSKNPVMLRVVGKLYPSSPPTECSILTKQTAYVTCGAPIPRGADSVIKIENTVPHNGEIEIRHVIKAGENVAQAGEDVRVGSLALKIGEVLRPQDVGFLAGIGLKAVKVFKKPRVAIISTGDELFELSKLDSSGIVDNYALIVSSLISELGGVAIRLGIAPDELSEIKKKIDEALQEADIIVTIGGCSVGEKDLVPDAIDSFGKPGIIVHGIRVKPGRVTGFGVIRGKPIVMLPGLIASTLAGFYLILAPLVSLYRGLNVGDGFPIISAKMNRDLEADNSSLWRFLTIYVRWVNSAFIAEPILGGASSLSRFVKSNGFILLPPKKALEKGEEVNVTMFSNEEFNRLIRMRAQ
ncbi:MAG: molybdopterin molybdotransferase MoeA [Candidatus Bathyarchaeia archaeon]